MIDNWVMLSMDVEPVTDIGCFCPKLRSRVYKLHRISDIELAQIMSNNTVLSFHVVSKTFLLKKQFLSLL